MNPTEDQKKGTHSDDSDASAYREDELALLYSFDSDDCDADEHKPSATDEGRYDDFYSESDLNGGGYDVRNHSQATLPLPNAIENIENLSCDSDQNALANISLQKPAGEIMNGLLSEVFPIPNAQKKTFGDVTISINKSFSSGDDSLALAYEPNAGSSHESSSLDEDHLLGISVSDGDDKEQSSSVNASLECLPMLSNLLEKPPERRDISADASNIKLCSNSKTNADCDVESVAVVDENSSLDTEGDEISSFADLLTPNVAILNQPETFVTSSRQLNLFPDKYPFLFSPIGPSCRQDSTSFIDDETTKNIERSTSSDVIDFIPQPSELQTSSSLFQISMNDCDLKNTLEYTENKNCAFVNHETTENIECSTSSDAIDFIQQPNESQTSSSLFEISVSECDLKNTLESTKNENCAFVDDETTENFKCSTSSDARDLLQQLSESQTSLFETSVSDCDWKNTLESTEHEHSVNQSEGDNNSNPDSVSLKEFDQTQNNLSFTVREREIPNNGYMSQGSAEQGSKNNILGDEITDKQTVSSSFDLMSTSEGKEQEGLQNVQFDSAVNTHEMSLIQKQSVFKKPTFIGGECPAISDNNKEAYVNNNYTPVPDINNNRASFQLGAVESDYEDISSDEEYPEDFLDRLASEAFNAYADSRDFVPLLEGIEDKKYTNEWNTSPVNETGSSLIRDVTSFELSTGELDFAALNSDEECLDNLVSKQSEFNVQTGNSDHIPLIEESTIDLKSNEDSTKLSVQNHKLRSSFTRNENDNYSNADTTAFQNKLGLKSKITTNATKGCFSSSISSVRQESNLENSEKQISSNASSEAMLDNSSSQNYIPFDESQNRINNQISNTPNPPSFSDTDKECISESQGDFDDKGTENRVTFSDKPTIDQANTISLKNPVIKLKKVASEQTATTSTAKKLQNSSIAAATSSAACRYNLRNRRTAPVAQEMNQLQTINHSTSTTSTKRKTLATPHEPSEESKEVRSSKLAKQNLKEGLKTPGEEKSSSAASTSQQLTPVLFANLKDSSTGSKTTTTEKRETPQKPATAPKKASTPGTKKLAPVPEDKVSKNNLDKKRKERKEGQQESSTAPKSSRKTSEIPSTSTNSIANPKPESENTRALRSRTVTIAASKMSNQNTGQSAMVERNKVVDEDSNAASGASEISRKGTRTLRSSVNGSKTAANPVAKSKRAHEKAAANPVAKSKRSLEKAAINPVAKSKRPLEKAAANPVAKSKRPLEKAAVLNVRKSARLVPNSSATQNSASGKDKVVHSGVKVGTAEKGDAEEEQKKKENIMVLRSKKH